MNKVALEIVGLSYSHSQSGAYALILGDKVSQKRLPIIIGSYEAQSIAMGIEKVKGSRPVTHDLFKSFADNYNIKLKEVIISRFQEGVFYAILVCELNGELSKIDARPSDAIAMAVRFGCEIYAYDNVMDEAGLIMDDIDETTETFEQEDDEEDFRTEVDLDLYEADELDDLLQQAIDLEDYEKAAKIRDEMKKRNI
jgi:Uncharacterized conserved protein